MCVNSGYFVTETGSSSIFTAVLDRQLVLDTKQQEHHSIIDEELYNRTVGGKMHHGFAGLSKFFRNSKAHMMGQHHHTDGEEGGRKHHKKGAMGKSKLSKLLK